MKVVKGAKILAALRADGWILDRVRGSHQQFVHPTKKGIVTFNGTKSTDFFGTLLKSLEAQSGLEF